MKRSIISLALFLSLFIAGMTVLESSSAQGLEGNPTLPDVRDDRLAATVSTLTNRSGAGLKERKIPGGGYLMALKDQFQNVMLSRLDEDGDTPAACVTSIGEANAFLGRDLNTGAPVYSTDFEADPIAKEAARHGMGGGEYTYYLQIIEEAQTRRAMNPEAATIQIVNADGVGEGFNSTAVPTVPGEGGNLGTTLGEQRLILFNFAAQIWGSFIDTNVPIKVQAEFNPLTPCSSTGGVLGSAGTTATVSDFPNAPFPNTRYHFALANKIAGVDLGGGTMNHITTRFNSDVDTGCLGTGTRFYYGLNNSRPSGTVNLLVVLLHELGHGMGFSSFANSSTGSYGTSGKSDMYGKFLFDRTTGKYWNQMTDLERQASAINTSNLLWDGPNARLASGYMTAGRDAPTGRLQMFTPNPVQSGSSVSHWDSAASPNLLMEPSINAGLPINLDLTRQQMRDIGWFRDIDGDLTADTIADVLPSGTSVTAGSNSTVTWNNGGGFNGNVTIELSTDGGVTFPTVIASDVANSGSYGFTVPNITASQARIRVREYDFVSPAGQSAADFVVGATPTLAAVTVATNPAGLSFKVDGTTHSTPQAYSWTVGTQHSIEAITPQFMNGLRYDWTGWSDSAGRLHTLTASSSTVLTANFTASVIAAPFVTVSGRVFTPDGRGLRNTSVTMVVNGVTRYTTTNTAGYYSFENIPTGAYYLVRVVSRRYRFAVRNLPVSDNLSGIDFTGTE